MERYSTLDQAAAAGVAAARGRACSACTCARWCARALAQPPVFATPPGDDGYPRVGGYPLEVETARQRARGGRSAALGRRRGPEGPRLPRLHGDRAREGRTLAAHARWSSSAAASPGRRRFEMRPLTVPWTARSVSRDVGAHGRADAAALPAYTHRAAWSARDRRRGARVSRCSSADRAGRRTPRSRSSSSGRWSSFRSACCWLGEFPGREFLRRRLPGLRIWAAASRACSGSCPSSFYLLGAPVSGSEASARCFGAPTRSASLPFGAADHLELPARRRGRPAAAQVGGVRLAGSQASR